MTAVAIPDAKPIRTEYCAVCGEIFSHPRQGRPRVTCSAECKRRRGKNGAVRVSKGSETGAGVPVTAHDLGPRHSGSQTLAQAEFVSIFGWQDDQGNTFVEYLNTEDIEEQKKEDIEKQWKAARRAGGITYTEAYGLPWGMDEGRTCRRNHRVIGQWLAHDWQMWPEYGGRG